MISYKKIFKAFIWFLFLSFLVLYYAQANGYYQSVNNRKKVLTEDAIKRFEEDVRNGEKIDVNDYLIENKKNYSNKISRFGLYTSEVIGKYFKKGINGIFSNIDKMMDD